MTEDSDHQMGNHLLPDGDKPPTITISGETWTYIEPNRILVSSQTADKQFMVRMLEEWDKRNDI